MGGLARRVAFQPEALPRSVLTGMALVPPLAAGLVIFGAPAAYMLAIAVATGLVAQLALRLTPVRLDASPAVTAVIGVALLGPGAPLWWSAAVAAAACVLEVGRSAVPFRALPLHSGLWAYAAVYLAGHGQAGAYLAPGRSSRLFPEPIHLWHTFFGGASAPLDPVTLYMGNVAGPVFGTSLLAVGLGAAWLWYAKRLDVLALAGVAAGAVVASVLEGWNVGYQVISGPLWFAAVYCFADRRLLAGPPLLGGLFGGVAALVGVGARSRGVGIEAVPVAFAAAQLLVTVVVGSARALALRGSGPATREAGGGSRRTLRPGRAPTEAGGQLK